MTVMAITDNTNKPFYLGGGDRLVRSQETFAQDTNRGATALAPYTVVAKNAAGTWTPMTDTDAVQTSAYLTCGTLVGAYTAWDDVTDGSFKVTVDGEVITVTGLNFSTVTAISQIPFVINSHASVAGKFRVVDVNGLGTIMRIESLKKGLNNSSISVLSAAGVGTDVGGSTTTGLNGFTGTGTITAATGDAYTAIPAGIYVGSEITGAALVAGTVTKKQVLVGGFPVYVDKNQLVFEGSQALTSVITANGVFQTVEDYLLNNLGIVAIDSVAMDAQEND
jgi:hypothetical protein